MPRKKSDTVQLSKIRMRESLHASLAEEAKAKDISLNAVIVDRLQRSRAADARMVDFREYLAGEWGRDVFEIAVSISKAVVLAERGKGKRWVEDQTTFELFTKTVQHIATNYRDSILRNYRDTSELRDLLTHGGTVNIDQLAEAYALLCGRGPPQPRNYDAKAAAVDRENSLANWRKQITKSRPLASEED